MRRTFLNSLIFAFAGVLAARAEVTLRYSYEMIPGPMVPPQAVEEMKSQMPDLSMRTLLKGNKALTTVLGTTSLSDFDGVLITLLDSKNKRFLTVSPSEYLAALGAQQEALGKKMPPQAKAFLEQLKMDVKSRRTGQTRTIRGMQAEELETTLGVTMPGMPDGMRIVISMWTPTADQVELNPALRELRAYAERAYAGTDPLAGIEKVIPQAPGLGAGLKQFLEEAKKAGAALEMRMSMYMPQMSAMAAKVAADQGRELPADAASAPMMVMVMKLEELSTAEIPASVFEVPRDYSVGSMAELLAAQVPVVKPPAAGKQP